MKEVAHATHWSSTSCNQVLGCSHLFLSQKKKKNQPSLRILYFIYILNCGFWFSSDCACLGGQGIWVFQEWDHRSVGLGIDFHVMKEKQVKPIFGSGINCYKSSCYALSGLIMRSPRNVDCSYLLLKLCNFPCMWKWLPLKKKEEEEEEEGQLHWYFLFEIKITDSTFTIF